MVVIERLFGVRAAGSTPAREVRAGLVTFATLSYILFVQPALLGAAGMDPEGVLFATCVASAVGCLAMALLANHPFALAPAMGHNAFFAFTLCGSMGWPWQQALAANLLAGAIFLALAPTGLRARVLELVPRHLQAGIGAGIGFLIAFVGLQWGGLVQASPATLVAAGDLGRPEALLTLFGLALGGVLLVARVPGGLLLALVGTALAGWLGSRLAGLEQPLVRLQGLVGPPPSPAGTAFHLDLAGLLARPWREWLGILLVLLYLDLFDTVGSLLTLGRQAGSLTGGRLPRARGAFTADALATVVGAGLGTSTVTSYVESAAGIAAGGRTGLTALTTGLAFLAALFLSPLIASIGAGVPLADGRLGYPVLAPVLVLVGSLLAGALTDVDWKAPHEAVPAFLTALVIPLTLSIADGIAWGVVATSLLFLAARRSCSPWLHGLAALLLLRHLLPA